MNSTLVPFSQRDLRQGSEISQVKECKHSENHSNNSNSYHFLRLYYAPGIDRSFHSFQSVSAARVSQSQTETARSLEFLLRKKYRSLLGSGQWHESNLEGITLTGSGAPGRLLKLSEPREVHTGKSLTLCHPWRMRLLRFCVHLEQPPPLAVC